MDTFLHGIHISGLDKYLLLPVFRVLNVPFIAHCLNISLFNIHLYIVNFTLKNEFHLWVSLFFILIFSHIEMAAIYFHHSSLLILQQ